MALLHVTVQQEGILSSLDCMMDECHQQCDGTCGPFQGQGSYSCGSQPKRFPVLWTTWVTHFGVTISSDVLWNESMRVIVKKIIFGIFTNPGRSVFHSSIQLIAWKHNCDFMQTLAG